MNDRPVSAYLIAGEASGDLLGAHLMRALGRQGKVQFSGVGGERMAAEGLTSLFPYHELSMMGFVEILPYAFKLMARINLTVDDILTKRPDVIITIDSPGFCFRVVEKLREQNYQAKFIHYVAPTVWAYKPERAEKCAKLFDHLLVLLPFEPPYFEKVGLGCTFVGHPVIAETEPGDGVAFRTRYQIPENTPLFCLLPGSRKGEISRHMPVFARAIRMLATQYPELAMAVAVPKHVLPSIAPYFEGCPFRAVITGNEQDKKDAIAASNVAIVKSGTIALEVAQAGRPMIVAYRVHPVSAWMMRQWAKTKYVNLINILLGKEVVPEFLQEDCEPLALASAASQLLQFADQAAAQTHQSAVALSKLFTPGSEAPSDIAARTIWSLLSTR